MKQKFFLSCFFMLLFTTQFFAQENKELAETDELIKKGTDNEGYKNAIAIYTKYENQLTGAQLNLYGFCYWKLEDYKPALKYFEMSAAKGDVTGRYNAGYNYFYGNGTPVDYQKAYNFFNYAFSKWIPEDNTKLKADVDHFLAHCYEHGTDDENFGNPMSFYYKMAETFFKRAAENGNVESMLHLGDYYNNSDKIKADLNEAKKWYQQACENNNKDACNKLNELNQSLATSTSTQSNENQTVQESPQKKKGEGLLKVLNALNDGLNTYSNAGNNTNNKASSVNNACSGTKVSGCYKNSTNIDCHCCTPVIRNGRYICTNCGGEIILTNQQKVVKPVKSQN